MGSQQRGPLVTRDPATHAVWTQDMCGLGGCLAWSHPRHSRPVHPGELRAPGRAGGLCSPAWRSKACPPGYPRGRAHGSVPILAQPCPSVYLRPWEGPVGQQTSLKGPVAGRQLCSRISTGWVPPVLSPGLGDWSRQGGAATSSLCHALASPTVSAAPKWPTMASHW